MTLSSITPRFLAPLASRAGWGLATPALMSPYLLHDHFRDVKNHLSPRYELTNDKDKFEVSISVPGLKPEDIDVTVHEDKVLSIRGGIEEKDTDTGHLMTSNFSQSFSLDPATQIENLTANLKDGILHVMAPKDVKKLEENVRKIAVNYVQAGGDQNVLHDGVKETVESA